MPTSTTKRCRACNAPTDTAVAWEDGSPVYACPEHVDFEKARAEELLLRKRASRLIDLDCGAGARFEGWHLDDFAGQLDSKKLELVTTWRDEFHDWEPQRNLIVHGDVGVGKSTLAYAAARSLIAEHRFGWGISTEWVAVRQLLAQIKASFNGGPPIDRNLTSETNLVILDDLGAERVTEWTRDWLAAIIEERYDHGAATIVTTNYTPAQLAARLGHDDITIGQRLVSRLIDNAVVLELRGADRRKRAA